VEGPNRENQTDGKPKSTEFERGRRQKVVVSATADERVRQSTARPERAIDEQHVKGVETMVHQEIEIQGVGFKDAVTGQDR